MFIFNLYKICENFQCAANLPRDVRGAVKVFIVVVRNRLLNSENVIVDLFNLSKCPPNSVSNLNYFLFLLKQSCKPARFILLV